MVGLARQFDYRMNELSHTVVNGFNQINENTERRKLETDQLVGCSLVEAGTNLLRHSSPGDLSTDSSDDGVIPPSHLNALLRSPTATELHSTPNTAIVVATPPDQHRRFRLEMKHPCLLSMWNEWYGFDLFSDCFGGIDGRNKQHGSTWRKHLNASAYSQDRPNSSKVLMPSLWSIISDQRKSLPNGNHCLFLPNSALTTWLESSKYSAILKS